MPVPCEDVVLKDSPGVNEMLLLCLTEDSYTADLALGFWEPHADPAWLWHPRSVRTVCGLGDSRTQQKLGSHLLNSCLISQLSFVE